jgi:hypothetical protein
LAVNLVNPRQPYRLVGLNIEVGTEGITRPIEGGKPTAQVALDVDVATFMEDFVTLLTR